MNLKRLVLLHWPIIIILAFAAVVRFWRLEALTTFGSDQGYDFLIVKRMLVDGKFTLLGPKIGPYNNIGNLYLGPAYYYLIAPFLFAFHFNPIGPAVFTASLAIATIFMIYVIAVRFISKTVAVLASGLYAFNAFLIDQSRATSNPHLIPFFSSIFIFSLLQITLKKAKSIIWPILCGFSLGIMFQLHYLTISLFIAALVLLTFSRKLTKLIEVILAFIVIISPQIMFEIRHEFFITNQFFRQITSGQSVSNFEVFKAQFIISVKKLSFAFFNVDKFSLIIFIPATFLILIYLLKDRKTQVPIFLLILTVIFNLSLACLYPGEIGLHYFASIYVHVVILIAIMIVALFNLAGNYVYKSIVVLLVLQIFAINFLNLNLFREEGYTMPKGWNLIGIKIAASIIKSNTSPTERFNIASTLDGDTRAMPYRYLLETNNLKPLGVEDYPSANILFLVCRDEDEAIKRYTVWEVASFSPFRIVAKWEIQNGIKLYKLAKAS